MAPVNKVVYDGTTLIDLTQDTVTASALRSGYTAHQADGALVTGTLQFSGEDNDKILIRGEGAPTAGTVGGIGQRYADRTTGKWYVCTAVSENQYTWESYTPESRTAVLSGAVQSLQDAVTPISMDNTGAHNSVYRGKALGSAVTAKQYAAISAGTFEGLYIGDYWTIGGVNWRIAAFDYYLHCGDTDLTAHHAVIVPDKSLYKAKMNQANTAEGGYVGSAMYRANLGQAKTAVKAAFSGHVLKHRIYLTNAVTNGCPSAGAWVDSEVDLMNEQMVYGGPIFMPLSGGTNLITNYRVEKSQLPLFIHRPDLISNRDVFWLRDVGSASHFAFVDYPGHAGFCFAGYALGVRPAFCICA